MGFTRAGSLPPEEAVRELASSGARWVRLTFATDHFGNTDSPAFYEAYDDYLTMYERAGMEVVALVGDATVPGTPADWRENNREHAGGDGHNDYIEELASVTARIAERFEGRVKYLEVWNEPNCRSRKTASGRYGGCAYIYPSNFAAMLASVYTKLKIEADIDLQVVSGGVLAADDRGTDCARSGADYLADTYHHGIETGKFGRVRDQSGTYPLDAVGQHLYINQAGPVDAFLVRHFLDCVHDAVAETDTEPKDTVVTEFGWPSDVVGQDLQGENLQTAFTAMAQTGYVPAGLYFTHSDFRVRGEGPATFGIWSCVNEVPRRDCRKASYGYLQAAAMPEGRYADGRINEAILETFTEAGGEKMFGSPVDEGSGPYVRRWDVIDADVQHLDGGTIGPSIFIDTGGGAFFVRYGFRKAYLKGAAKRCGVPRNFGHGYRGGTRQDFATCYMTWHPEDGVVIHDSAVL